MSSNSSPRISILIAAKNASKTISAALLSAVITRPRGSEIVVLLDGNDTDSKALNYFEKLKIVRVYRSNEVLGISGARNFLLSKAKSDVISWIDADDIALPFRYGKSLRSIEQGGSDLCFSHSIIFGERLKGVPIIPQFPLRIEAELSPFFLWQANPFVQSTTVARKSVILAVGGYRDCAAEDYDLWMRLATEGFRLTRNHGYGVLYRLHHSQITSSPTREDTVMKDSFLLESHQALTSTISNSIHLSKEGSLTSQVDTMLRRRSIGYRIQEKIFRGFLDSARKRFLN